MRCKGLQIVENKAKSFAKLYGSLMYTIKNVVENK